MTLLSVINRYQLTFPSNLQPQFYMDSLDYWTEFSIECHFRQLVAECQTANATGTTETEENDDLPPIEYVLHG